MLIAPRSTTREIPRVDNVVAQWLLSNNKAGYDRFGPTADRWCLEQMDAAGIDFQIPVAVRPGYRR